ncbi:saccharopine dehydrogenase [Apiospora rasikravindrae]|uniref:Saccharopine dehydrogenase n=1 Tax=Apiospora rasikravindrae TaxID=990691 RepID=A0ABR1RTI9_9PEZI
MESKKILVLGSGMVAQPCVDYLLRNSNNAVTVACRTLSSAEKLVNSHPRATALQLDVASTLELEQAIAAHDVIVSLVPFIYHAQVVRLAIKSGTNVVTTSYVSPAIRELDGPAREAGVTIFNEVGVDPGIDHLYAIKAISEVHAKGGKVREFYSYCGGLPAPEAADDNPLKFKFSWSPRGALLSQNNSATFLKDGEVVTIANKDLMAAAEPYYVLDGYSFVAYPNRNSAPFREFYQIPEAHTVIRGSMRYEGNPAMVKALIDLGWLGTEPRAWLAPGTAITWAQIQQKVSSAEPDSEDTLIARVDTLCGFMEARVRKEVMDGLRWMGLFSNELAVAKGNPLDTLSARLAELCSFQPGERDLVMLQHKFVVEWQNGTTDIITSTMELFGEPDGYSGMAKSVGVTCGIATQLLVDGHPVIAKPGVVAPYTKEICDLLREQVEREGIEFKEVVLVRNPLGGSSEQLTTPCCRAPKPIIGPLRSALWLPRLRPSFTPDYQYHARPLPVLGPAWPWRELGSSAQALTGDRRGTPSRRIRRTYDVCGADYPRYYLVRSASISSTPGVTSPPFAIDFRADHFFA